MATDWCVLACLCAGDKERCPWLSMPLSTAYAVLQSLLESVGQVQGSDWLTGDSKAEVLGQILARTMLGRKVYRAKSILQAGPNKPDAVTCQVPLCLWQDAENAGVCSLVRTGELQTMPAIIIVDGWLLNSVCMTAHTACLLLLAELDVLHDSPDNSRASSGSGAADPCSSYSSNLQQPALSAKETLVSSLLNSASWHLTFACSCSPDYTVFMTPLSAVAAMRYLRAQNSPLKVPLQVVDCWRSKKRSDNAVPLVRLLIAATLADASGESVVHLSDLLPPETELPGRYWGCTHRHARPCMRIQLPRLSTSPTNPTLEVHEQLSPQEFETLCKTASYDGKYAFINTGNTGPDTWLVLQTVGDRYWTHRDAGPLVLFVKSEKHSGREQVTQEDLEEEAKRCWGKGSGLQRLLLYITDQRTDHVNSYMYVEEADLFVVVIGPKQHPHTYSSGVELLERCIEFHAIHPKRARGA